LWEDDQGVGNANYQHTTKERRDNDFT